MRRFRRRRNGEDESGPLSTNIAINIYFHFFNRFSCAQKGKKRCLELWILFSAIMLSSRFKDFHMLKGSLTKGS